MYKRIVILLICICVLSISTVWTTNIIAEHHGAEAKKLSKFEENWHHCREST